MRVKSVFALFMAFLFIFPLQATGSSKKENVLAQIMARVEKDRERTNKIRQGRKDDEPEREKQMAIVDACFENFDSCTADCGHSSCEDGCLKDLSSCEKDVPLDLKTIKE
jgi:hypothetical protein